MTLRVGIRFRRIGRGLLQIANDRRFEVVAINEIVDPDMLSYLLRLNPNDEPATTEVSSESRSLNVTGRTTAALGATENVLSTPGQPGARPDLRAPAHQHRETRPRASTLQRDVKTT